MKIKKKMTLHKTFEKNKLLNQYEKKVVKTKWGQNDWRDKDYSPSDFTGMGLIKR